jgi:hypothetical protein
MEARKNKVLDFFLLSNLIDNFMERYNNIVAIILTFGLFACNDISDNTTKIDCNFTDKKIIYEISKSIINEKKSDPNWSLNEIDTTYFFTTEDYFTNTIRKNRLVLIGGSAALSSGTANNLLILFSCSKKSTIINWSGQIGDFKQSDIKDLNGDGIKEIVCNSSMTWMGEYNYNYNIFNFKGFKQNFLFRANSISFLDYGLKNLNGLFKQGDTLERKFDCTLIKVNTKDFRIFQIRTIKIHNGGEKDEEIIKKLKIVVDTLSIKLK